MSATHYLDTIESDTSTKRLKIQSEITPEYLNLNDSMHDYTSDQHNMEIVTDYEYTAETDINDESVETNIICDESVETNINDESVETNIICDESVETNINYESVETNRNETTLARKRKHTEIIPISTSNKDYSVKTLKTEENKRNRVHRNTHTESIASVTSSTTDVDTQSQDPSNQQTPIMYTMSPLGKLQMIVNRFIYFLRYTSVKGTGGDGHRNWRCVEYFKHRCQAIVVTKNDVIVSRMGAHNHGYHDKRILKKVQSNSVLTTVNAVGGHNTRS